MNINKDMLVARGDMINKAQPMLEARVIMAYEAGLKDLQADIRYIEFGRFEIVGVLGGA